MPAPDLGRKNTRAVPATSPIAPSSSAVPTMTYGDYQCRKRSSSTESINGSHEDRSQLMPKCTKISKLTNEVYQESVWRKVPIVNEQKKPAVYDHSNYCKTEYPSSGGSITTPPVSSPSSDDDFKLGKFSSSESWIESSFYNTPPPPFKYPPPPQQMMPFHVPPPPMRFNVPHPPPPVFHQYNYPPPSLVPQQQQQRQQHQQQQQKQQQQQLPLDIDSLLGSLIRSGLIKKPKEEEKEPDTVNDLLMSMDFSPATLSIRPTTSIINNGLYPKTSNKCSNCASIFEDKQEYAKHLDWHFREKQREKQLKKTGGCTEWYVDKDTWTEKHCVSIVKELVAKEEVKMVEVMEEMEGKCFYCWEDFDKELIDDLGLLGENKRDGWYWVNCVREEEKLFHPTCC